jgi:hypothetical protein
LAFRAPAARAEWGFSIVGGLAASGELYKAKADVSRSWTNPAGNVSVEGTEIRTEVDEYGLFGIRVLYARDDRWGASFGLSLTDMDVNVFARSAAGAVVSSPWDQLFILNLTAAATFDLLVKGNTPYLLAGVGYTSQDSEGSTLDQSGMSLVLGGGFRIVSLGGVQIELEVRDNISGLELDGERDRLAPDEWIPSDRLHVWEITAGLTWML